MNAIVPIVKQANEAREWSLSINELQNPALLTRGRLVTLTNRDRNQCVPIDQEEMSKFTAEPVSKDVIWKEG